MRVRVRDPHWGLSFDFSVNESSGALADLHLFLHIFREHLDGLDSCFGQLGDRLGEQGDGSKGVDNAVLACRHGITFLRG